MTSDASALANAIAALRTTRVWRGASDTSLRAAAEVAERVRFARGDLLVHHGRTPERLVVILSGRADVRVDRFERNATYLLTRVYPASETRLISK